MHQMRKNGLTIGRIPRYTAVPSEGVFASCVDANLGVVSIWWLACRCIGNEVFYEERYSSGVQTR